MRSIWNCSTLHSLGYANQEDGKTISGVAMRAPEELPTRIEALRLYTQGSAWFSFEEHVRGARGAH